MTEMIKEEIGMRPEIKERMEKIRQGIVPEGYKKTRIGIIPIEWNVYKLKEICTTSGKYGINAKAVEFDSSLPRYLRITDISSEGRYIKDDEKSVDHKDSDHYLLKKNDIVFARTGNTTGKTYLYREKDGKLVYAGFLIKYTINDEAANPNLVFYHTQTERYWNWVKVMSARSGQPGINSQEYNKLLLPLGPLNEQQKIADILSTWDQAIELKESLIKEKEEQKKGLMQKLLTGEIRLQGFTKEWEKWKLGELGKFLRGRGIAKRDLKESGINCVLYGEIYTRHHFYIKKFYSFIDQKTADNSTKLNKNDILFTSSGETAEEIGKAVAYIDDNVAYAGGDIIILRPKKELDSLFLSYLVNVGDVAKRITRLGQGHSVVHIYPSLLTDLNIKLPSLKEQKKISNILKKMDKTITLIEQEIDNIKKQKKGLMQLLLTGIVRVEEVEQLE